MLMITSDMKRSSRGASAKSRLRVQMQGNRVLKQRLFYLRGI